MGIVELYHAVNNDDFNKVAELLYGGADIHSNNDFALSWSTENGQVEMTKFLLDRGADIHANNDLALLFAVKNKQAEMIELLLDRGANIHAALCSTTTPIDMKGAHAMCDFIAKDASTPKIAEFIQTMPVVIESFVKCLCEVAEATNEEAKQHAITKIYYTLNKLI